MNFFAHYYFHHKPNNAWHNAGLLFPDMLRIFTNDQRLSEKTEIKLNIADANYQNLVEGFEHHFKADDIFHNWDWFKVKCHEVALMIRQQNLGIERDWFLAHIFIELAIDHVLVIENEQKVKELYADLAACDKKGWEYFFKENDLNELDKWYQGYTSFIKNQYIFSYKDTDSVIYALNRIYLSTGIGQFDDIQNRFLVLLLNKIVPEVKLKLKELHKVLE